MKTYVLFSLLILQAFAALQAVEIKACDQSMVLEGEFTYKKRVKKSKQIEVIKERGVLKETWEGNDQAYSSVYLRGLEADAVIVSKISPKSVLSTKEYSITKSATESLIDQFNFSTYVLGAKKPFKLKLEFMKDKKVKCFREIQIVQGD